MEYARPRSTDFCSTSIADAIEKTLQLVENRLYKQKVAVEKKLEPDLPRIQADSPAAGAGSSESLFKRD